MLYKFGERCFPRLLFVVVQFAKFFGIHPRAFCHRYGSSGKPMPLLGEGPVFLVFHHGSFVKCRCTHSSMAEGLVPGSSAVCSCPLVFGLSRPPVSLTCAFFWSISLPSEPSLRAQFSFHS